MPIYEYRCDNGHTFEVMQKMTDDPVSVCGTCEAPVQRVFHPIAVHFKGKGFYNTDYGTKRRNRELERSGKEGGGSSERPDPPAKSSDSSSSSSSSDSSGSGSGSGSGSASGSGDKKKSSDSGSSSSSSKKKS
jgi:putative FmdB family regulatory protein